MDETHLGQKAGPGRRRIFPNKPWVISNILVKLYHQTTSMFTTNVGD
jgi:hypothetical protein